LPLRDNQLRHSATIKRQQKNLADLNDRHDHAFATGRRFKARLPPFSSRLSRNIGLTKRHAVPRRSAGNVPFPRPPRLVFLGFVALAPSIRGVHHGHGHHGPYQRHGIWNSFGAVRGGTP
jgi:hypothetical protein